MSPGSLTISLLLAQALSFATRVDALRDVERVRYGFTLEATRPFDEVYPRAVFETLARRQEDGEKILKARFALEIPREVLEKELGRIDRSTAAPDQWEAVKRSLGNDRERILQVVVRPLVVDRALRRAFAFDQRVHARPHENARAARNEFLLGKTPAGSTTLKLASSGEDFSSAEMRSVLERELRNPGDVTTILEEAEKFSVFRLVASEGKSWSVVGVRIPKRNFEPWFEEARRAR